MIDINTAAKILSANERNTKKILQKKIIKDF